MCQSLLILHFCGMLKSSHEYPTSNLKACSSIVRANDVCLFRPPWQLTANSCVRNKRVESVYETWTTVVHEDCLSSSTWLWIGRSIPQNCSWIRLHHCLLTFQQEWRCCYFVSPEALCNAPPALHLQREGKPPKSHRRISFHGGYQLCFTFLFTLLLNMNGGQIMKALLQELWN